MIEKDQADRLIGVLNGISGGLNKLVLMSAIEATYSKDEVKTLLDEYHAIETAHRQNQGRSRETAAIKGEGAAQLQAKALEDLAQTAKAGDVFVAKHPLIYRLHKYINELLHP